MYVPFVSIEVIFGETTSKSADYGIRVENLWIKKSLVPFMVILGQRVPLQHSNYEKKKQNKSDLILFKFTHN